MNAVPPVSLAQVRYARETGLYWEYFCGYQRRWDVVHGWNFQEWGKSPALPGRVYMDRSHEGLPLKR